MSGTCGGGSAPEAPFLWRAPSDGTYRFHTVGSSFDTLLYVLAGNCGGPELGCNDDTFDLQSEVVLSLSAGELVTVVVDGFGISSGDFELHIEAVDVSTCPDGDLGATVPVQRSGSTTGAADEFSSGCGGESTPDRTYVWEAPWTGDFVFDTFGSTFDTVLYVLDGVCGGPTLACNDDAGSDLQSRVDLYLYEGDRVTVVVDGLFEEGSFDLNIDAVGAACPDADLGSMFPVEEYGSTVGAVDKLHGSCQVDSGGDFVYEWTAPATDTYTIDTFGSSYDTVLYVLADDCGGPELACDDDTFDLQSQVVVDLAAGETIMIAVDGWAGATGSFVLRIN